MNTIRGCFLVLGLLVTAAWGGPRAGAFFPQKDPGVAPPPGDKGGDKSEKRRTPRFTISKETTYVTGPVDKDGCIDYAAALNERLGKGVGPADNANVLLWKAFGPRPAGRPMPPEFFKWMGVETPPERGDYYIDPLRYLKEHPEAKPDKETAEILNDMDRASVRPWTERDYPYLAAWLKANERPVGLVVKATSRPQYYSPLVAAPTAAGPGGLLSALLPGVQKCRALAQALTIRAMLRVGQGRPDEAWQDLLACHRLGRLLARGGTLIEALVGIAIDNVAANSDVAFLDRARLNAKQTKDCLRDLQGLPPVPALADRVNLGERFLFLDTVMMINRHGLEYLEGISAGRKPRAPRAKAQDTLAGVDWDPALRNANRWYDRLASAMRLQDRAAREKQFNRIDEELKGLKASLRTSGDLPGDLLKAVAAEGTAAKARGKLIGDLLISLLMPAIRKVQQAGDRIEQVQRNLHVAFALAAYQREHGNYPKTLDALAPKYLPHVPPDLFSGKALVYHPSEKGYLLYSVGVNGRDEQGRSYDDDPPGDDLPVRMPLPPLPRR
jgi:hypothetical protein